jgi:acyl-CoA dehydrogenase
MRRSGDAWPAPRQALEAVIRPVLLGEKELRLPVGDACSADAKAWHGKRIRHVMRTAHDNPVDSIADALIRSFDQSYWLAIDEKRAFPDAFFALAGELGVFGMLLPESSGGTALGPRAIARLVLRLHEAGADATSLSAQALLPLIVLRGGPEVPLREALPRVATGAVRMMAVAATEPDSGLEVSKLATTAASDGSTSNWVLRGSKIYISFAMQSDWLMVLADANGAGPTLFAVPREGTKGLELRPLAMIANRHTTMVFLDDVSIPDAFRLGPVGKGLTQLADGFSLRRIAASAEAIGNAKFCLGRAAPYAIERKVFGRPIGANQGVQYPIAQAAVAIHAAELALEDALVAFETRDRANERSAMARLLAGAAAEVAVKAAFTTFGGMALAVEAQLERKLRESTVHSFDNLLLGLVAERVLHLPRGY